MSPSEMGGGYEEFPSEMGGKGEGDSCDGGDSDVRHLKKPCLLVPFVGGADWIAKPGEAECEKMGAVIARLHLAVSHFHQQMPNPRGADWRRAAAEKVRPHLPPAQASLAEEELARDAVFSRAPLPAGACHCDLFRNNVLWRGGEIAAVIDFYFGGDDALIFDLAVAACDWCFDDGDDGDGNGVGGDFDSGKLNALLAGYLSRRRLCALERKMLADAFCVAALRFWLSRLYDLFFPRRARVLQPHDPAHFERALLAARGLRERIELAADMAIRNEH